MEVLPSMRDERGMNEGERAEVVMIASEDRRGGSN